MKIKLMFLTIILMSPFIVLRGSDIMEKKLLQYKYVILIEQITLDLKKERKIYYVENKTEIQETINWLKEYYPERRALNAHMRAIMACCYIIFTDKIYTSNADTGYIEGELFWGMYMNFDIDGKKYFTKEQLTKLYKIFEEKGTLLKFDD